ncbi:MAG TPA: sigma-54 dependent transcriptional regulator [Planctomycetota bacterium]|nr:sigma-54 dependent transcriptional regulator [Planctomycetota bacterium]
MQAGPADTKPLEHGFRVLVVDDADELRRTYAQGLSMLGYEVEQARNGHEALVRVRAEEFDAVVLDLNMPGMDGLNCLKQLKEERSELEVIIVTGYGTIPSAVEAMRLGAYDYIAKPFSFNELDQRLKRCMQTRELRWENRHLRGLLREKYHCENLIGKSEPMQKVFRMIRQVAQSRSTVLLQGRSGTGKELVARAIHFNSPVAAGPMITVDCGAIAPTVIESELFGHVKGAFTGAVQAKEGLFRMARGGTLFFDEIGELPLEMQTKLLRALQEREIRPVGSDRTYPVDVRVIAATHKDLQEAVKDGRFREDLFYRLNVITIHIPALAERKEDIPLLLAHFLKKHSIVKRAVERVDAQAMQALMAYDWPGNVRELENVVERALALGQGNAVTLADLPPQFSALVPQNSPADAAESAVQQVIRDLSSSDMVLTNMSNEEQNIASTSPLAPPPRQELATVFAEAALNGQNRLDDIEKQAILATLHITGGDRTACAKILGIDKSTLYRKLKRYNFAPENAESADQPA